jgi:hypothetical protein
MQPRNEKVFTRFSKAGSNDVESAAILMKFVAAPYERWAELAKCLHDKHGPTGTHERARRSRSWNCCAMIPTSEVRCPAREWRRTSNRHEILGHSPSA